MSPDGYFKSAMHEPNPKEKRPAREWAKRAGIVAFLFFLGKGLIWLGVLAAGAYYALQQITD